MEKILILVFAIISVIFALNYYLDLRKANALKKARIQKMNNDKLRKIELIDRFLVKLDLAKTLNEIYILHLQIWGSGIQNANIGPNKYGIFRTNDIMTMTPNEIYLGNIDGLWTKTLEAWEKYDDEYIYEIIRNQYANHLTSNLKAIKKELKNEN